MQTDSYLNDAIEQFQKIKTLADKAIVQISKDDFFAVLDEESNSVAIIIKHLAGNMRSRWTDFLATDGEKPDRNRDSEFIIGTQETRESVLEQWEVGWRLLFEAITPLSPLDLGRTVYIRNEPHSVLRAINRQLTHYAYHVGQIVFLGKHFAAGRWRSLSVPRGRSEEFNVEMREKRS
ncbi:MAG: DUF1572 domain-containing protein [Acidobacteriia bacterium]|nr:DUF1572 domain-containing protein [Terriglobia bacterium]